MAQFFEIHPESPQPRLIKQAVEVLHSSGVIVYPTDSGYAFGCQIGDKNALQRIRRIRGIDEKHYFALVCQDLSEISTYAMVEDLAYRMIKAHTPAPYTFVLRATREVPRRLMHPKRKTIGLRVPDNNIALALSAAMGEPIMNTSLILPDSQDMLTDAVDIRMRLEKVVDLVIDGGFCGDTPTTIIDFTEHTPDVIREGAGSIEDFIET